MTLAIDKGKEVHDVLSRQGLFEHDIMLGGAVMHIYARCGPLPFESIFVLFRWLEDP